jgi:putative ABC transport system permease protein
VFRAPMLSGRRFHPSEHESGRGAPSDAAASASEASGVVIVNESFVRSVLGGRNPIGRRLRYVSFEGRTIEGKVSQTLEGSAGNKFAWPADVAPPTWYEIVGVVRDLGMAPDQGGDPKSAGIYHPVAFGASYPGKIAVHVRGDAASFAPRLRAVATDIDPALRLDALLPMNRLNDVELQFINFWFRLLLMVCAMAMTLSLAGIYSVMSFTVARRTREIGVRVALGASPRRVIGAIFARPLTEVAIGVVVGTALAATLAAAASFGGLTLGQYAILAGYATIMLAVCTIACIVPTRRALRVQPTEALRAEG